MHFSKDQDILDLSYLPPEIFLPGSSCKIMYIHITVSSYKPLATFCN